MANKKDFSTSLVATAPSPADSGTSLVVTAGQGTRFPGLPFFAVVHADGVLPTLDNAEVVSVTARATDTLTIVRAQKGTVARSIAVGDRISNAIFFEETPNIYMGIISAATFATTGNKSITAPGFMPRIVEFTILPAANSTAGTAAVGAMTAASQFAMCQTGTSRNSSTTACMIRVGGGSSTLLLNVAYVSMDVTGFTVNVVTAETGFDWAYKAIG